MFEKIKRALKGDSTLTRWASARGLSVERAGGEALSLEGTAGEKTWRIDLGQPTRDYIQGEELRGRAELGLKQSLAVVVMNRPLKEALERKAYSVITDGLQTTADAGLPEEMRWLAMFREVGWEGPVREFWDRYCVLTNKREAAVSWIEPRLGRLLMEWPRPGLSSRVPFVLVLVRGKAYLRMEHPSGQEGVLQHATNIFSSACEDALSFRE